jgi:hypothetical protein
MTKRLIITENERNEILNLHKSNIFEAPNDVVLGNQETPVVGANPSGPTLASTAYESGKPSRIMSLQTVLNKKFNSGLIEDGKWGPKTAAAVLNALKSLSNQQPIPQEEPTEKLPTLQATPIERTNTTTQLAPGQPTPQPQEPENMKDVEGAVTPLQGLGRRLQRR